MTKGIKEENEDSGHKSNAHASPSTSFLSGVVVPRVRPILSNSSLQLCPDGSPMGLAILSGESPRALSLLDAHELLPTVSSSRVAPQRVQKMME